MSKNKTLKINGTSIQKEQLEIYLQKIASNHNISQKTNKNTYPIIDMLKNFNYIQQVYSLLTEHLKLGISIHPAGEWLLDNLYIIEETVKQTQKELSVKKYCEFPGIADGQYKGYARIYVLASEIVAYTDNVIDKKSLESYLLSYQTKKTLGMEEIWNIGTFLQIAIIANIKELCEKIFISQVEKYKAENIAERLIENKEKNKCIFQNSIKNINNKNINKSENIKYPFIEYMAYILKRYGKKGYSYLKTLEETVEMSGTSVSEVIKKEHFTIAVCKVSMGNCIISSKKIQRINFSQIFENINRVEDILRKDPAKIYDKMDNGTKNYYRAKIKELAKKTKISEIYIAKKILELSEINQGKNKEIHIGYYLIDKGITQLYKALSYKNKEIPNICKVTIYMFSIYMLTTILSLYFSSRIINPSSNIFIYIISSLILLVPMSEVVIQTIQYILSKCIKPKLIPKLDLLKGIDKENATMVIIPTILKSKEKVQELTKKLEVFYIANKSKNIYFTLLGDCFESIKKEEEYDVDVIKEGIKLINKLNEKYQVNETEAPIFNFMYRNRTWNEAQNMYLGWERKRGLITEFNQYMLGKINNPFRENTIEKLENKNLKKIYREIKYIITLDSDTDLVLNTGFELIGSMAHILNKPILNKNKTRVVEGYGIMQPHVGVNLDISNKTLFTKIFAGKGGIDSYSSAASDIYQDNFSEGIFTGKGIYDLKVFSDVIGNRFPENTILSHDLLEGSYLRCALVSDINLMDGYPTKYNSYINRVSRWTRGDWQITQWIEKYKGLNQLSRFKIFDNIRRSLLEITLILYIIFLAIVNCIYNININTPILIIIGISILPFLLDIINNIIFKKENEKKLKTFYPKITGIKSSFYRGYLTLANMPFKAYVCLNAILKTIYRKKISNKNLLEWQTSEEAEKKSKTSILSYTKTMSINIVFSFVFYILGQINNNYIYYILSVIWFSAPYLMWYISKDIIKINSIDKLDTNDKYYYLDIAKKTWCFFEKYLTEENNYLITDNYQEDRKEKIVDRTSSTNIGLSLLAVLSAYDLKFLDFNRCIDYLNNILNSVNSLEKWNGHLYNWYNIYSKEPLNPRYVSTVDSGNLVGYLFTTKSFIQNSLNSQIIVDSVDNKCKCENILKILNDLIYNANFSVLYSSEQQIFSIGFNVEENKLTDSYYDLLASEARQASLVAIAKKDVPVKHWSSLSRTHTTIGEYKGLVSWSGTAFEYLMPNINLPLYEGSLLDESCKFLIKNQMDYAEKLNLPWGISESAFNLKDLQSNYQYKAFGIPWLGLKRGLADEMVVSSYGSLLAVNEKPKEEIYNLKRLEKDGMKNIYGFYEAIDYTPDRAPKGKNSSVVKTYMAHHQGLILLSINNLFNSNIFQKRMMDNPEIESVAILLQETMPEKSIITKEIKEKIEKLKYKDYDNYSYRIYTKIDERLISSNIIASEDYVVAMDQKGQGVSKYKDIYINKYKPTEDSSQGIFFEFKNINSHEIWSSNYSMNKNKKEYQINFMPDKVIQEIQNGNINTKIKTTISSSKPVEIRRIVLENQGIDDEYIEITAHFKPVLSSKEQEYAHPVFNNLFLISEFNSETNSLIFKRKARDEKTKDIYLVANLNSNSETVGELEYEIDDVKFNGRGNLGIPQMVQNSIPFSNNIRLVTQPVVAMKKTIKVKHGQEVYIDFVIGVGEEKENILSNLEKYKNSEYINNEFELSKAKVEAESRYLSVKAKEIDIYQKMLSYMVFENPTKSIRLNKLLNKQYKQSDLWKYGISGDYPIILIKIQNINEAYVVKEVLKAYEFFRLKNIDCEIVIINEEKYSYENYVESEIDSVILNSHLAYMKNIKGGIFVLSKPSMEKHDLETLDFVSNIIINSYRGGLENSIKELEEEYLEKYKNICNDDNNKIMLMENIENEDVDLLNKKNLKYNNEYGAFTENGKEYLIKTHENNRLPTVWSHIIANEKFGSVVTENMGGYSFYKNSRLNRITAWSNNPNLDIPSEIIYLKDENNSVWSLGLNPKPDDKQYNIIYGFGYVKYIHQSNGIKQELEVFVPKEDSCKVSILKLENTSNKTRRLKLYYYIKPVLGEDEIKSNGYINIELDKNNNILTAKNLYSSDFEKQTVFIGSSKNIKSYTGDKQFFLGEGGISNPSGIKKMILNNENAIGKKPCMVYELEIEIPPNDITELSLILGSDDNMVDVKNMAYKYGKVNYCKTELEKTKKYWQNILSKLQVETPLESTNIMLNGWLMYQTICSRLYAKSGYYQSGGAIGFRDQLQDTIGLKYLDINFMKNQIINASRHQFIEGDVLHWWHDETKRGIRTRFSDDLLWLPYILCEYLEFTQDESILEIQTNYLQGEILANNVDEKYDMYLESEIKENIFMHSKRAIDKSLNFGENGLPKIGSGDWNDGFSTVGNKGKGESIWLGFFLYTTLARFIKICEKRNEQEIVKQYTDVMINLKKALNTAGWDGRWYKRAYMDDGNILGSIQNEECRIDSIAQSWATISGAGDNDKKFISMESLENHLVDRENGIIKLLDPPFEKGKLEPGYIKSYIPGTRENGGQYTHGAIWTIIAEAMLGFGDKANEYFRMINPIEHAKTKVEATKYKVEPYVIAADVYGSNNLLGRGGWTWYTGSSSWFYEAGIKYILGLKIENGYMEISPNIPNDWPEFKIKYMLENKIYMIHVKNINKDVNNKKTYLNKKLIENNKIKLEKNTSKNEEIINIDVMI